MTRNHILRPERQEAVGQLVFEEREKRFPWPIGVLRSTITAYHNYEMFETFEAANDHPDSNVVPL